MLLPFWQRWQAGLGLRSAALGWQRDTAQQFHDYVRTVRNVRHYDVIVIGAGPAGCSAAYDLAGAGVRVLLLDRTAFPRTKPCAGMLTVKAVNLIRYSIAPVIRGVARSLDLSLNAHQSRTLPSAAPIA